MEVALGLVHAARLVLLFGMSMALLVATSCWITLLVMVLVVGIMGHLPSLNTSIYVEFLPDSLPESARRDFVVSSVGYR